MQTVQTLRPERPIADWLRKNRRAFSALLIFLVLWILGFIFAPGVFFNGQSYTAIFTNLPVAMILAVPLVFIVASGETDLSFPAVFGLTSFAFSKLAEQGVALEYALLAAFAVGALCGVVNGVLITRAKLSSLVSTLGMNFLLRGLINMVTQGIGVPLTFIQNTTFHDIFVGQIGPVPMGVLWAIVVVIIGYFLFNHHQFGAQVRSVGDNPESAKEMGINVANVKTGAYVFVGLCAALASVISSLLNNTWWPTSGDGYLLPTLAAVFIGGTPTWGGVGTIIGSALGAVIVGFIETGLIGAGLTAFYTQFFYGLVIILSLLGHRINQPKARG